MELSRRLFIKIFGVAAGTVLADPNLAQKVPNSATQTPPWFIPKPPLFPSFSDRNEVIAEARRISTALENHIVRWLDGTSPARIPNDLLPSGYDANDFSDFTLVRPEDVRPEDQWGVREAEEINLRGLLPFFPDPHCTYIVNPVLFAPFGSKVVIEGRFPHCRFFDIQTTPPFHPEAYHYNGNIGVGEVPIVDADIDPLPGNVNPFRVGADRLAKRRGYRVEFDMALGNPADIDDAFQPPYYRAPGNSRKGGGILYQGAWGLEASRPWGHGRGLWDHGQIWLRYYAPDNQRGPLAGVPLPRVHYELPDGRRYFIKADWSRWERRVNTRKPAKWTWPENPTGMMGPTEGWGNQMGIFRAIVTGFARGTGLADQAYVRALDKGVAGRGSDMPAPGNFEPSATSCTYINYLLRGMSIDWGKVIVLTGKLPRTPRTRNGERMMRAAQARYWSITTYDPNLPDKDGYAGAAITSLMDDEIAVDDQNRYVIVYSWDWTRPNNATVQNGVTWKDWGPTGKQSFTVRWLSVHPEWSFNLAPNEQNLGWRADWASTNYDRSLIGNNDFNGFLGEYLPRVHFMTKEQFEGLGQGRIDPNRLPIWT